MHGIHAALPVDVTHLVFEPSHALLSELLLKGLSAQLRG